MKISPWFAVAALLVIAAAALPADPPAGNVESTITDSTGDRAFTDAACDENDQAFDVKPDTDAARAAAQAWCERSGAWLDTAPWPSGFRPIPLDDALNP